MRFGLPEDFNVLTDQTCAVGESLVPLAAPTSDVLGCRQEALFCKSYLDSYSDQISHLVGVNVDSSDESDENGDDAVLKRFDDLRRAIDEIDQSATANLRAVELQVNYTAFESTAQSNIDFMEKDSRANLSVQNDTVQKLIVVERERIRKEQELQRQRELEAQAKLLEEKKRREEEERKRKEEIERKKQEEIRKQQEEELAKKQQLEKIAQEKELETKRKQELEQKKKQAELDEAEAAKRQAELKEKQASSKTDFVRVEKLFLKYKQDIADIKANVVQKLQEMPEIKKHANQLRRKINPKFGQLSNSFTQLRKISEEVTQFIRLAQSNELAYKWILNFVAKAVVDQAETEVIVKPTAALPLARLACHLLNTFPEFEYYLTARFIKKCPYIIGYSSTIETEEGRLRMGYKRKNNQWEDSVKYDERVSGICTVWAVMSRLTEFPQLPQYSFEASWTFLARLLNTDAKLLTNAHFSVVANWWDASASYFLPHYGRQSLKLLQILIRDWPLSVSEKKFPAAARLLILGEDWVKQNTIQSLKEMEN